MKDIKIFAIYQSCYPLCSPLTHSLLLSLSFYTSPLYYLAFVENGFSYFKQIKLCSNYGEEDFTILFFCVHSCFRYNQKIEQRTVCIFERKSNHDFHLFPFKCEIDISRWEIVNWIMHVVFYSINCWRSLAIVSLYICIQF